jgi:hypothetical protein
MNASVGLLPLPRPLMAAEVLDAGFRLFRSGILHCLPYSGLAVLVIELPTLYATFLAPRVGVNLLSGNLKLVSYLLVFLLAVPLLGLITLRLNALAEGSRPRFRPEVAAALSRWPMGIFATAFAFGYPLALWILYPVLVTSMPGTALVFAAIPVFWPVAMFLVTLPAFWCDRLTPIAALVTSLRVSIRRTWRMFGVALATLCMVMVFFVLSTVIVWMMSPLFGRADLFLIATVESMLYLVVGAFGVPFVLAVLIVAYRDLQLRELDRRGAGT